MRSQFAKTVYDTLSIDNKAMILIGDISHYLLKDCEEKFPNNFYNMGICEQSLIGLASGMAIMGDRPIVHTIAPFCVERSYEQIKIDLCYQKTDVTIVSVGSSFDYASLGCTHHCYEDISILRSLPNMQIFLPGNSKEFDYLFKSTWGNGFPKYFKLSSKEHKFDLNISPFEVSIIKEGKNKTIFVTGHLLQEVIETAEDDTIIYVPSLSFISDGSKKIIIEHSTNKNVITVEENSLIGGLGDLIFDIICSGKSGFPNSFKKIGIPLKFLEKYGTAEQHRTCIKLDKEGIREQINEI